MPGQQPQCVPLLLFPGNWLFQDLLELYWCHTLGRLINEQMDLSLYAFTQTHKARQEQMVCSHCKDLYFCSMASSSLDASATPGTHGRNGRYVGNIHKSLLPLYAVRLEAGSMGIEGDIPAL